MTLVRMTGFRVRMQHPTFTALWDKDIISFYNVYINYWVAAIGNDGHSFLHYGTSWKLNSLYCVALVNYYGLAALEKKK